MTTMTMTGECVSCARSTTNVCTSCWKPLCLPCPPTRNGHARRAHICNRFHLRRGK
jgi:hypothetical protein